MAGMNIFTQDAFSSISLTGAFERVPYRPMMLGSLGLFDFKPVRTRAVMIEERDGRLRLVPQSQIGAPPKERVNEKRRIRPFATGRIAEGDTIMAEEVAGIRDFGNETELMQVQSEVMRRYTGPDGIQADVELTLEYYRLGAIQGQVRDGESGDVLYDWFDEWGIDQAAEINFALTTAATNVHEKCNQVRRAMQKASKGSWVEGRTEVHALVGDEFFDALVSHPNVEKMWLNWAAAADLRGANEWQAFRFGDITWHNYRGSDTFDSAATKGVETFGIATTQAKFFPRYAPGVFQEVYSFAEFIPWVNTLGRKLYALQFNDPLRNAYTRIECFSYPLMIVTNPAMLQRARKS